MKKSDNMEVCILQFTDNIQHSNIEMSSFFHNNREGQTKRESKGHKKKVTTNSFNQQFTIYANVVNSNFSEDVITPQKINHKKIQIMKQTLKSQQKSDYTISHKKSGFEPKLILEDEFDYNVRLENLKSNLQVISKRSYNECESQNMTKRYDKNLKVSSSYLNTKPRVQSKNNKSTISMEFNKIPKQDHIELYQHQSEQLQSHNKIRYKQAEKQGNRYRQKIQNSISFKEKAYKKPIKNESLTIHINNPPKVPHSSSAIVPRNLIQKHRNKSSNDIKTTKVSRKESTHNLKKIGQKRVHRGKITQIIVKNQNVFTCSLDYGVNIQDQLVGECRQLYRHRGGVEGMLMINDVIYSIGRDMYLKYRQNQYRFDSCPKYLSPLSEIHITVGCMQNLNIFDTERCKIIREQCIRYPYVLHSKDYVSYLSTSSSLSIVDKRCSSLLQQLYNYPNQNIQKWILHPYKNQCALIQNNCIQVIDSKRRKVDQISIQQQVRQALWSNHDLYLLTNQGNVKVWSPQSETINIDTDNFANLMRLDGSVIYFGDQEGNFVTKIVSY